MDTPPSTREHLLEVGLKQLRSTGYTATGVKEVLDLAAVPKGSFYHYFSSKEAFVGEVLDRYATSESLRWQRTLGDHTKAPLTRLRQYFDELIAVYGPKNPITGCLIGSLSLEIADQSPKLQARLQTAFDHWQHAIATVLREAIAQQELPQTTEPEILAGFLLNSYQGALVRVKAEKNGKAIETFLHFAFDVLLKKDC